MRPPPPWVFVRHAQSRANAEGWLSGHADVGLTPAGRVQARRLAVALAPVPFVRVVSSDLRRARRTAELASAGRRPVITTPALRERALGRWTGRSWRALEPHGVREVLSSWHLRPPGGESLHDVAGRVLDHLAGLPVVEGPTLVVAHGGVLRALLGLVDGLEPGVAAGRAIDNATPCPRELGPGGWLAVQARWRRAAP